MSKGSAAFALDGKRVLVTAGATREHLDPIRFLTNASTGRMGYALASAARAQGARVVLVAGPTSLPRPSGVTLLSVESADQMHREVLRAFPSADVVIGAAAVSDWKFASRSRLKIKRSAKPLKLTLVPNADILADLGRRRRGSRALRGKVLVGFALETHDRIAHARRKLERKGLDLIVANGPESLGGGLSQIAFVGPKGRPDVLPPMSKDKAARAVIDRIAKLVQDRSAA